jgi:enoyl-CoA hydratase/carnithine racemase
MDRAVTPVYEHIQYGVDDPAATITLNRPEQLNAWTLRMGWEVRHAVTRAAADPAVVGVILTATGRGFCAGADMNDLAVLSNGGRVLTERPDELRIADPLPELEFLASEFAYLMSCPKPIVAAINGTVVGMGLSIALHCDVRFMATDAALITGFAQRGLVAEWGLSWLLSRLAGPAVAMDLLMSSRKVTGEEAAALGLVNRVLPGTELIAHARSYIEEIAQRCSPSSLAVMKQQVWEDHHRTFAQAAASAKRLMAASLKQPDFREGVRSFLQKRAPTFGRLPHGPHSQLDESRAATSRGIP